MSEEGEKQVAGSGSGSAGTEEVPDPELDNLLNGKGIMFAVCRCQSVTEKYWSQELEATP